MHPDFKNDETQYKLCKMAYMGAIKKFSLLQDNETVTSCNTFSQLQPPVISAPDFLKEKGISVAKIFQTENIAYDEFKRPKREFVSLHDLLTDYLQRQGQKTNQNKL